MTASRARRCARASESPPAASPAGAATAAPNNAATATIRLKDLMGKLLWRPGVDMSETCVDRARVVRVDERVHEAHPLAPEADHVARARAARRRRGEAGVDEGDRVLEIGHGARGPGVDDAPLGIPTPQLRLEALRAAHQRLELLRLGGARAARDGGDRDGTAGEHRAEG